MSDSQLIQVGNYPNLPLAEVAKTSLVDQGIYAEIFNGQIDTYFLTAAGGIQLMVRSEDVDSANSILETDNPVDENVVSASEEIGSDTVYCSNCHSKKITSESVTYSESEIPGVQWLKNHLGKKVSYRCDECGYEWKL